VHQSNFLIIGPDATLLVDTGVPSQWSIVNSQLDQLLGDRPLDYVFPTHPEFPHSANLRALLEKYPSCRVVGDTRDLHVYRPAYQDRYKRVVPGDRLALGGTYELVFQEAIFKDLPNSLWAYESGQQVLFVADGFSYSHRAAGDLEEDDPLHMPGECAYTARELGAVIGTDRMAFILRAALYWTRYVDVGPHFDRLAKMLRDCPTRIVAPAHANVVDDIDGIIGVMKQAHRQIFEGTPSW
jgi:hypothetical protein